MQTVTPSLPRVVFCRHSRKISCETLAHITVESHCEGASFYRSDDEKACRKDGSSTGDGEASEFDCTSSGHNSLASHHLQQARKLERRTGKLDFPSCGDGKAPRHTFLALLLSKAPHMPASRRAKKSERLRKHHRAYPNAIHGTGGVLPHSGSILLHIGSQSSRLCSTKATTSLRASASILPQNTVGGEVSPSEPSSPKVTCLGRVRNKQKQIVTCTSTTCGGKRDVLSMLVWKRGEKKNGDTEAVKSASKKTSRMSSGNAVEADRFIELCNGSNSQKPAGKGTVSSECVVKEERKSWSLTTETTRQKRNAVSYQNQRKLQSNGAMTLAALSSKADYFIDLSRFVHEQSHEIVVGNDSSQRPFEQEDTEDCVPAPPRNALLLIRNRKVMDYAKVIALSASTHEHGTSLLGDTRTDKVGATPQESDQVLPLLLELGRKKPTLVTDILRSISLPMSSEMKCTSPCTSQIERFERKFSLQTELCWQASVPKSPSETRLWQRRAVEKPRNLEIWKPVGEEINRLAAVWVNKK